MELSPSVDVPVTVTTVWTGPARFMAMNTSEPVAGSTATYNSTVMLSSFERDQSGEYNCTVTISSMSSFIINSVSSSSTTRVTVGKEHVGIDYCIFVHLKHACTVRCTRLSLFKGSGVSQQQCHSDH